MQIHWWREGIIWRADIGASLTLCASPEETRHGRIRKGTRWRASVTRWDAATRTASRVGEDEVGYPHGTAEEARRAAEAIYNAARHT
ncbi:MAG: hypothetical protein K2Q27_05300 [Novosphingobium sp.]|nr:hypothetical protein [Novosphingobium sp.]